MAKAKREAGYVRLVIYTKPSLKRETERIADEMGLSASALAGLALRAYLDNPPAPFPRRRAGR